MLVYMQQLTVQQCVKFVHFLMWRLSSKVRKALMTKLDSKFLSWCVWSQIISHLKEHPLSFFMIYWRIARSSYDMVGFPGYLPWFRWFWGHFRWNPLPICAILNSEKKRWVKLQDILSTSFRTSHRFISCQDIYCIMTLWVLPKMTALSILIFVPGISSNRLLNVYFCTILFSQLLSLQKKKLSSCNFFKSFFIFKKTNYLG